MPNLNELLQEYHGVLRQIQQLEEKKRELRADILEGVQQQGNHASLTVGDTEVRAIVRSSTGVEYDEDGLRQRLGERFRLVLDPDAKKIRKHLPELRPALEPFLDTIGSISRELVAQHIQAGSLSAQDFSGLYKKSEKNTLVIKMVPVPGAAPARPTDADLLD